MSILAVVALGVVVAAMWLLRQTLSEEVLAQWFASKGIEAHYRVAALSADKATLISVTIGPPDAPEFRADRVDIRLRWSLFAPQVDTVTLLRPKLRGTVGPGGLSFGDLDRFLPKAGAPARPLPDIDLRLIDARAVLTTRAGTLVASGGGRGRLRDGFAGRFAVASSRLQANGCTATVPGTIITVRTERSAVRVAGGGRLPGIACEGGIAVAGVAWGGELKLPPDLSRYTAQVTVQTQAGRAGDFSVATTDSSITANAATLTGPHAGRLSVTATGARTPWGSARGFRASGGYRFDRASGNATARLAVSADHASVTLPLSRLDEASARMRGTLAAPLTALLVRSLGAASRNFDASATIDAVRRRGAVRAIVARGVVTAATGARVVQRGWAELANGGIGFDGGLDVASGGLPGMSLSGAGRWRDNWPAGSASLSVPSWTAPGAAVDGLRLHAVATGDTITVTGDVGLSGKLGGGVVVEKLGLPVAARFDRGGGVVFGERCLPLSWSRLSVGAARLSADRIDVCPAGAPSLTIRGGEALGSALISATSLRGRAGGAPLGLTATPVRIGLSGTRVTLSPVTVTGQFGARRGRATLDGSYDLAGAAGSGRVRAAMLDDPNLPVLIADAATTWRMSGARLTFADASARIVDRAVPARFQPLRATEVQGSLVAGVLAAHGNVRLAAGGVQLGRFDTRHDLDSATGSATLATGTLMFGPTLQPYEITENLRGIVANVRGPVIGNGRVDWIGDRITSRGTLRIDKLALATEALGPIDGIDGEIVFDDLLAVTTPPRQTLRIGRINPGVAVDDGVVVFRLLGPDAAAIDSIVWPYAGGRLSLSPVTIRAGDLSRNFLLTVDGMDAQAFLQRFEIKNLDVTGRFDGRLPLVFAGGKGRIAAGRLVARPGGGLVQYVGEIGTEQVGAAARLAFDALRRLRYRDLTLDLDGDLDGELVTQVRFAGRNEAAATLTGGPLPVKATGLPFRFGITVRAPFRALLGTAASFSDVRPLLRTAPESVQPK